MTPEPLLNARQLAGELGVTRRWIYQQVEERDLPAYKIGKSLAFEVSAVRAWLASRRIGAWPEPCDRNCPADFISDNMGEVRVG
jgi:excisionase family DNA binding protein